MGWVYGLVPTTTCVSRTLGFREDDYDTSTEKAKYEPYPPYSRLPPGATPTTDTRSSSAWTYGSVSRTEWHSLIARRTRTETKYSG